ncbi:MAG: ABC transporter substrate-binding protein [Alphaproteobacteria bacterium]|nr:ABC transporter substrate-binding protein [Alphaproteobacteria bacterium]
MSAVQIESAYASSTKQNKIPSEEEVMKTDKLVSRRSIIRTSGKTLLACKLVADLGYLEEFGLEVTFSSVTDGNRITGSIISGEADACMLSGFAQIPVAVEKGANIKMIAGATLLLNQCVFAKNPNIKTVKDLVGKTVGVGSLGSLLHQLMVALLAKKGIDPNAVKFANVGNNQDVFRAVVAGVVDAGPSTIDVYNRQAEFGVHSLTDGEFWVELPEYTQQGSFVSQRAINTKRDQIVRLLAAYAKLYRYLHTPESKQAFITAMRSNSFQNKFYADQWRGDEVFSPPLQFITYLTKAHNAAS